MPGESFSVKAAFEYFETDNLTEGVRRAGLRKELQAEETANAQTLK